MNFLAHTTLAAQNDDLLLGGLLGDFVRGRDALQRFPEPVRRGIKLHRFIDTTTDHSPQVKELYRVFRPPFRRYAGIIVDLVFDHVLATQWSSWSQQPLAEFDARIRKVVSVNQPLVPERLQRFMSYAERRGLFAAYAQPQEVQISLAGLGRRLKRTNPLHRVNEIWPEIILPCQSTFETVFPLIQGSVADWLKRKSTTTGS